MDDDHWKKMKEKNVTFKQWWSVVRTLSLGHVDDDDDDDDVDGDEEDDEEECDI